MRKIDTIRRWPALHAPAIAIALMLLGLAIAGCDEAHSEDASEGPTSGAPADAPTGAIGRARGQLKAVAGTPRELVDAALAAFASRDTAALEELLIDRDEFMSIVYPELGAHYAVARDTRSETMGFLWENQHLNAIKGMRSALRELAGTRLAQVTIEFTDGEKRFPSYRMLEGTRVTVRDSTGRTSTLLALGSVIEKEGRYKLISYRDLD